MRDIDMRRSISGRITGICLTVLITASLILSGCGGRSYPEYVLPEGGGTAPAGNTEDAGPGLPGGNETGGSYLPEDGDIDYTDDGGYVFSRDPSGQLTEDDIQKMNGGNAVFVYDESGNLTTLVGRFSDQKVTVKPNDIQTFEEGISALQGIAGLLGLSRGCRFLTSYGSQDKEGYTYLTYQQRSGSVTVSNATLHIVIDPEGYPAAVSSSFSPSAAASETAEISAEEALNIAQNYMKDQAVEFYPEETTEVTLNFNNMLVNTYVVYCSNPVPQNGFENMAYVRIYVAYSGEVLGALPTSNFKATNEGAYNADDYFEGMERAVYHGMVRLGDGSSQELTLNTAYNPKDGLYYLMDIDRKIATGEFADFYFNGIVNFVTSENNEDWDNKDLVTFWNYVRAYDYYASLGIKSPDGFESPVLVLRNYVEANGTPAGNACFIDNMQGWYAFCYSAINNYTYNLDCVVHEYTHAVTQSTIQGNHYMNDYGAINEAYSDVIGNCVEMELNATPDTDWLLCEVSGETMRCMSDPNRYNQPSFIGDVFYVPNAPTPNGINDAGGVHINSSLIGYAAYLLHEEGMSFKDEVDLWYTSLQLLTPNSGFQDVYAALVQSARSNGMDQYEPVLKEIFTKIRIIGADRKSLERSAERNGCGRYYFEMDRQVAKGGNVILIVKDGYGNIVSYNWASADGVVTGLLPEGQYYFTMQGLSREQGMMDIGYTGYEWTVGLQNMMPVNVYAGQTTQLAYFE